jgi:peptidoglycan/xylan/chitin deacetylase (PgdA/CDA1 family)
LFASEKRTDKNTSAARFTSMSKRRIAAQLLDATHLGVLLRKFKNWQGLLTLAYHRIGGAADYPYEQGLWSATPEGFESQLRFLKKDFDVIGPSDLQQVLSQDGGRYVLISFDDGYRDNYETAFPILKAQSARAVFFLSTGFLDHPRLPWWNEIAWMIRTCPRQTIPGGTYFTHPIVLDELDRQRALRVVLRKYKSLPGDSVSEYLNFLADATGAGRFQENGIANEWMTWDMVREMKVRGMFFGGHTVNHPVLAQLPLTQQREEIAGCAQRLLEELGEPMQWFSYPVGGREAFNKDTRFCLKEQNVKYAFSYDGGFQKFTDLDPFDIPRTAVELDVTPDLFRAVLTIPQVFA